MNVYERVQELSKKQGISVRELGDKLGIGPTTLYKWKTQIPKSDILVKVANYFDVSTDYLLGRTDNKNLLDDSKKQKPEIQSLARKMDDFSQSDLEAVEDFLDFIMHKNKNK
nr:MAG TPA: repressor protein [Caudoviricetes sp.]